jgi:hypothetical protein
LQSQLHADILRRSSRAMLVTSVSQIDITF